MRAAAHQNLLTELIRGIAHQRDAACLLDSQGIVLFVNDAWDRFTLPGEGRAGSGRPPVVGTGWLDHLPGREVRARHELMLRRTLSPGAPRRGLVQVSEVNTSTTATLVSTRFEPVILHPGEPAGVRISHRIARERPIEEVYELVRRPASAYVGADDGAAQCPCCSRLRDPAEPERWDFVPELCAGALATEPVLCELCAELHYVAAEGL